LAVAPVLMQHVDADGIRLMLGRELPDLKVSSIQILGGGRDIRYQALDSEGRLYDRRRWYSPWLVDVNDHFILKIPTCSIAAEQLARARWALGFLAGQTHLPVPELNFSGQGVAFDGYRKLPGHELQVEKLLALPGTQQVEVAASVGRFLADMHRILPVPEGLAKGLSLSKSAFPPEQLRRRATRLLEADEDRHFVSVLADAFAVAEKEDWPPRVLHDDLHGGNLLLDQQSLQLSGVLDFESVAVGDPHIDFSWFASIDEELMRSATAAYAEAGGGPLSLDRCRLFGAVCDLTDAIWHTERGYPVEGGSIPERLSRIRSRLSGRL
jgi:aminoglycoside phosphotransferase